MSLIMKMKTKFKMIFKIENANSLRFQLLSRTLLLMAVVLIGIGVFQYILMKDFIYQNKAASMQSQVLAIPADKWLQPLFNNQSGTNENIFPQNNGNQNMPSNSFGHPPPENQFGDRPFPFFIPDSTLALIDSSGTFIGLQNSITTNAVPLKLSTEDYREAFQSKLKLDYKVVEESNREEQLVLLQPVQTQNHQFELIQVGVNIKPLNELLFKQLFTFLALALLALLAGILVFIPILRKVLVPLSNMVDTVEQIDAGNLAERFPTEQGQMEIDRLAASFNGMLERLEASFASEKAAKEQMRRFVADASHELRTPLTSIHGFLEVLLRGAVNQPDKLHKSLNSMYAESKRMKKLVQDLLTLAQLERAQNIQLMDHELDELFREMEPQLRILAENRQVSLQLASKAECKIDRDKIKQVILNLFQNAVQHTDPDDGSISLNLINVSDGVELTVKDNGPGIAAEHLAHLFERFYRSDSSRTRKYGGAGLGLAISKSIIDLHGGLIWVESTQGIGSTFYLKLPR